MIVNSPEIRRAFDRIGFVSVGQSPCVVELQRTVHKQLTGATMPGKEGATAESQLAEMQAACIGLRVLLVLDGPSGCFCFMIICLRTDVWDAELHERMLNCIDPLSGKLMVTTR